MPGFGDGGTCTEIIVSLQTGACSPVACCTGCLFVEPVACSPVTSCTGCLFSSYLFINCLHAFFHQLPIQVFKRFMCCSDSSLSIAAYLASRCFPAS